MARRNPHLGPAGVDHLRLGIDPEIRPLLRGVFETLELPDRTAKRRMPSVFRSDSLTGIAICWLNGIPGKPIPLAQPIWMQQFIGRPAVGLRGM